MSEGVSAPCIKLPIPLTVCPCCGGGVKQTRGFTWITTELFQGIDCQPNKNLKIESAMCQGCIFGMKDQKLGLIWVGAGFYKTTGEFLEESRIQGISRRLSTFPREFKVGETWVALAHPKAIDNGDGTYTKGIFAAFRPTRVDYIVRGDETQEELERLVKRGFTLMDVRPESARSKDIEGS